MSTAAVKLPLVRAAQLAAALCADLAPGCLRCEVAGSIRRRKPDIGDLELVCIPSVRFDLLGQPCETELDPILERLVERGDLRRIKGGDKYRQYELLAHGIKLDLFLTTADQRGLILLIRTGPAEFSHRFVTQRSKQIVLRNERRTGEKVHGWLPDDLHVSGGHLWRGAEIVPTPDERGLFAIAGLTYLEPWERQS